jgi:hypothetical protein
MTMIGRLGGGAETGVTHQSRSEFEASGAAGLLQ